MKGDALVSAAQRHTWTSPAPGAMLSDPLRVNPACQELFDPAYYGSQAQAVSVGGRQAAWFVQAQGWQGVLRGYRRGGLIARLSQKSYLWLGESRTRSFREFRLLNALRQQGLRVPVALGAAYWRHGLTYQAAILVERIPQARPLAQCIGDDAFVLPVARAIVQMHRAGVWHADLNAFNILIDGQNQVWLIDFDRGTLSGLSDAQRQSNLLRLRRSLQKLGGKDGTDFWDRLQQAYQNLWMKV